MENIRTDLAIEAHEMCTKEEENSDGIEFFEQNNDGVYLTKIRIKNEESSKRIGKPIGNYVTIEAPDIRYDENVYKKTCCEIANQIGRLASPAKTLVVGLGNKLITPDALGPVALEKLMITNHIKSSLDEYNIAEFSSVCGIIPGVLGTTGIETVDIIKGVAQRISPELIICVDALASRSMERVSTTFQICDTGINPGSGVENKRLCINEETTGVKVLAIGVPTVVDAATIAIDSIEFATSKNSYLKQNKDRIIRDILSENAKNMIVTPKDIDLVIERCAKTVANGINMALHKNLSFEDIESYVG